MFGVDVYLTESSGAQNQGQMTFILDPPTPGGSGPEGSVDLDLLPMQFTLTFEEVGLLLAPAVLPNQTIDLQDSSGGTFVKFAPPPVPGLSAWGMLAVFLLIVASMAVLSLLRHAT
jgi:hypothetical protein